LISTLLATLLVPHTNVVRHLRFSDASQTLPQAGVVESDGGLSDGIHAWLIWMGRQASTVRFLLHMCCKLKAEDGHETVS